MRAGPPASYGSPPEEGNWLRRVYDEESVPDELLRRRLTWYRNLIAALRRARSAHGRQEDVALKAGVSKDWLEELEQGVRWADTEQLTHLMAVLGVSPAKVEWENAEPPGVAARARRRPGT